MQNDAIKTPEECGSMDELRVAIDAVDRKLVSLLARRQTYIERAAELKSGREQVRASGRRVRSGLRKVQGELVVTYGNISRFRSDVAEADCRPLKFDGLLRPSPSVF